MSRGAWILATTLLIAAPAFGWGNRGHELINDAAARALPESAPGYLREATARLRYLGPEPDRWRIRELETLNRGAAPDHFIDLEWAKGIDPQDPPKNRHEYARIVARNLRKPPDNVGYAPYRVVELCERIEGHVASIALIRDDDPDAEERRKQARENVIFTAGVLGHYVADLSNPHHCTIHFNGWSGENPKDYPTDRGTHWRFESAFVERVKDELVVTVEGEAQTDVDYTKTIWNLVLESNGLVEDLYTLDKAKAFAEGNEQTEQGRKGLAFANARMSRGAQVLRDLWTTACVRGLKRGESESLRLEIKDAFDAAKLDLRVAVRLGGHVRVWGSIYSEEEGVKAKEIVAGFDGVTSTEFRLRTLY